MKTVAELEPTTAEERKEWRHGILAVNEKGMQYWDGPALRLIAQVDSLEADRVQLREALNVAEDAMDLLNGDIGTKSRPCFFCRAEIYDGQVGIVHTAYCPILGARAATGKTDG